MNKSALEILKLARKTSLNPEKIINAIFENEIILHGDKASLDDDAIISGLGSIFGQPVTFFISNKGQNEMELVNTHFGEPMPQGYRKVLRLSKQAEKFGRPIVSFVNVSGAFPGSKAERFGQAQAIAKNLLCIGSIAVPFISIFYGEGGSGGALALACGDELWMFKNSTFSVVSPEGFSTILKANTSMSDEENEIASERLKFTPKSLKSLDITQRILDIDDNSFLKKADPLKHQIYDKLQQLLKLSKEELLSRRWEHYGKY